MPQSTDFDRLKLALLTLLISLVLTIPMCAYGAMTAIAPPSAQSFGSTANR